MNELVSVITPSYNCAISIPDTIKSVLEQTYKNWEMIIVDDCSSDNSVAVISEFVKNDERITLVQLERNSGAAVARNTAIKKAQGRFIAFLDSDDTWLPLKLDLQIQFMQKNKVALSYTAYHCVDEYNNHIKTFYPPLALSYTDILKTCSIGCLTAVYDTYLIEKHYMPLIRKRQDFALWLQILKQIDFAKGIDQPLAHYKVRSDSISANKFSAAQYQWKVYRSVEKLNVFSSIYYFIHYAVNGFIKHK